MAKIRSNVTGVFSRLIKIVMVVVLLPLAIGLFSGILEQLDAMSGSSATFREWIHWGFVSYIGIHLLLYRPVGLFRVSHRMFSTIAVWLFGGQVASVDAPDGGKSKGAKSKGAKGETAAQGSTLVAFSPYVVPLYTVLVCALGWLLAHWIDQRFIDGPISFLIGFTIALHWIMTADDLQQQRERWYFETYLLAIGLIFILTLFIGALSLPLAVPGFYIDRALADGWARTHAIYTTIVQRLFF